MNTVAGESGAAGYLNSEGSDLIILLDNYMTGSSAPRVNYGDTALLDGKNITVGAQVEFADEAGPEPYFSTDPGRTGNGRPGEPAGLRRRRFPVADWL